MTVMASSSTTRRPANWPWSFTSTSIRPKFAPKTRILLRATPCSLAETGGEVRLEGHADERGSREYNIGLGERRAQAVRQMLMIQGVSRVADIDGEFRRRASGRFRQYRGGLRAESSCRDQVHELANDDVNAESTAIAAAPVLVLGGCALLQPPAEDPVLVKLDELERRMQAIERVVQNQSLVQSDATGRLRWSAAMPSCRDESKSSSTMPRQRPTGSGNFMRISMRASRSWRRPYRPARRAASWMAAPCHRGSCRCRAARTGTTTRRPSSCSNEQRYEPAAMAFQQFLVTYPDSELADNAQYWLAESHYVTQKFEEGTG